MGFVVGGGVCHEEKALLHCTFANGFVNAGPSESSAPLVLGSDLGKDGSDTLPRPALWSAILVPSLLNIV